MANLMGLESFAHSLMYSLLLYREGRFDEAKANGRKGLELNNADASWFDLMIDGSQDLDMRQQGMETFTRIRTSMPCRQMPKCFFGCCSTIRTRR